MNTEFLMIILLQEKENEILYLQSELEAFVSEKSALKNRLHQLEQFLTESQAQNSLNEKKSEHYNSEIQSLKTEIKNSKKAVAEEAEAKEKANRAAADEFSSRIQVSLKVFFAFYSLTNLENKQLL